MLLIKNPISSTKKLLRKTLNSFKSLFSSPSYQKLPKTTMDHHHNNSTKQTLISNPKRPSSSSNTKPMVVSSSSTTTLTNSKARDRDRDELVRVKNTKQKGGGNIVIKREERRAFVAQKIRELEMVDMGNIDHKLDIEEVLHYYSRLTCQPYLDLVDAFFVEVYAEFFDPPHDTRLRF